MPVRIREEIFTKLATAIRQASDKSASAESSSNDAKILEASIKAAEGRITSAEAQVTRHQLAKQELLAQPTPTKQIQGDGKKGGMKTVVDEREKARLTSQIRASDVQIQQAQSAVEAAREEADKLKSQTLTSIGISEDHQRSMTQLSSRISELKTLVNDPQTDLTSEDFQNKLKIATEHTAELQANLPDSPNPALKSFWDEIKTGFTEIQSKLVQASTPERATVRRSGTDYSGFFEDVDQGFNTIISHLERNNGSRELIMNITNAHDSIKNKKNNYLGGMSNSDINILADFLTNMNVIVNDINNGETIEQRSYDRLILDANRSSTKLAENGSNFVTGVIGPTFGGIAQNLNTIKSKVPNDEGLNTMLNKFNSILTNDTEKLYGFSNTDFEELDNFYESVREIKDKAIDGQITTGDVRSLVTLGNNTFNRLVTKFNLNTGNNNNNGSGNNGGTGRR
jgi:hypothetical protein